MSKEEFKDGLVTRVYIRNLSMMKVRGDEEREEDVLALRPERLPGDFLSTLIPTNVSLMLKGHLDRNAFVVDSVYDTSNEECMDYEIECDVTRYDDPNKVKYSFLSKLQKESESLAAHTVEKLEEWKEYLEWNKALLSKKIYGCRYINVAYDEEREKLVFTLVCQSQKWFESFKRNLSRDIQIFNLFYSKDPWGFELADMERKGFDPKEVGKFRGVIEEYYEEQAGSILLSEDALRAQKKEEIEACYAALNDPNTFVDDDESYSWIRNAKTYGQAFGTPYIAEVAYDLNEKDAEILSKMGLDKEAADDYIADKIVANYHNEGFLALSAIGELALIRRFEKAITSLERDENCYSPNLALWLFDIRQARLPNMETTAGIRKWLNQDISQNDNQKKAVYKMLAAPDVCLIQGPPGTGKTTVIAEAIYQFVVRGNRVLIASQSNDAVDNALERLNNSPAIRAIRLGRKGRRGKKSTDADHSKFAEDTALQFYYSSLADNVEKKWLELWDKGSEIIAECDGDIHQLRSYRQEISAIENQLNEARQENSLFKEAYERYLQELQAAEESNAKLQLKQQQTEAFWDYLKAVSDEPFNLPDEYLDIIAKNVNPAIIAGQERGVLLLAYGVMDTEIYKNNASNRLLKMMLTNRRVLAALMERLSASSAGKQNAENLLAFGELKMELSQLNDLAMIIDEDDEEKQLELFKKQQKIKKRMKDLAFESGRVSLTEKESECLTDELKKLIEKEGSQQVAAVVNEILFVFNRGLEKSAEVMKADMAHSQFINTNDLAHKQEVALDQYQISKNNIERYQAELGRRDNVPKAMQGKYGMEDGKYSVLEIIAAIEQKKASITNMIKDTTPIRSKWEGVLRGFRDRLLDNRLFVVDQEYYQPTYVNACNVVGISCTDNMKDLSDKNYNDFDVVIIDEVSKATPPELLIPLMKARKAILVGDHRQLPPMFNEHEGSYQEMLRKQEEHPEQANRFLTQKKFNQFKKMVTSSLFKEYFENADDSIRHSLLTQYRMHSDIMAVINRFYEQRLVGGLTSDQENRTKDHELMIKGVDGGAFIRPQNHAYWIDSSSLPSGRPIYETFKGSTSATNILEVHIIIELLKKIAAEYTRLGYGKNNRKTVGVISFYQKQVNDIRTLYKRIQGRAEFDALDVAINTVDRFQGQEKNIIICSLVRNNSLAKASRHVVAFERINVAFSRAQQMLVIVGAKHMYEGISVEMPKMDTTGHISAPVYKNIMEELNRKASFADCCKVITQEMEAKILQEYENVEERNESRRR